MKLVASYKVRSCCQVLIVEEEGRLAKPPPKSSKLKLTFGGKFYLKNTAISIAVAGSFSYICCLLFVE